jgi:2-(1,2-epoxy-1,2-dihydrophenyl)acetyl-CoA isomerase
MSEELSGARVKLGGATAVDGEAAMQQPAAEALESLVRYERSGAVAVISYARPARRNAWSVACVQATIAAIQRANTDADVGAIVLTGEGSTFCAGADLKAERQFDPETGRLFTPATFTMGRGDRNWITLLVQSKPVIAAVNGPAVGIGATHLLAADIRIAAESASFSFPFLRLGAMPECGCSALLPRLVGAGRALDIILRSATVSAQEALNIGLVTALYPDAELRQAAIALAEQIAKLPSLQVKLTKRMFHGNAAAADAEAVMRVENDAFVELLKALKRDKPL